MCNTRCVYIYGDGDSDFDNLLVSIYTYTQYISDTKSPIYVISKEPLSNKNKDILSMICEIIYLSPGKDVKQLLISNPISINITGKIYTQNNLKKTAVVAYIYYYEHWMEIYNHVKKLSEYEPIDLHVYMCTNCNSLQSKHILNCEQSDQLRIFFNWTQNNGRDVRSFLTFIKNKQYIKYNKICKVHTKRTTYLDDHWRSIYLERLLSPKHVQDHWKKLKHGETLSSLDRYLIYEKYICTNANYSNMKKLIELFDMNIHEGRRFNFYAGTMFWCSHDLCTKIDSTIDVDHLSEFEDEPIKNDGSLAHAWERVFCLL